MKILQLTDTTVDTSALVEAGRLLWEELATAPKGSLVEVSQAEHDALWAYNDHLNREHSPADGVEAGPTFGITPQSGLGISLKIVPEPNLCDACGKPSTGNDGPDGKPVCPDAFHQPHGYVSPVPGVFARLFSVFKS